MIPFVNGYLFSYNFCFLTDMSSNFSCMQSPLSNATNRYHLKPIPESGKPPQTKENKIQPYRVGQLSQLSSSSSSSDKGSPATQLQKLQSDLDCWQLRYEALEKQYTAKLAQELDLGRREKAIKDERVRLYTQQQQLSTNQQSIDQLSKDLAATQLELKNANQQIQELTSQSKPKEVVKFQLDEKVIGELQCSITDLQERERKLKIQLEHSQDEVCHLKSKLEQLNISQNFEAKVEDLVKSKQSSDMALRMREQEYNALKCVFHEKELDLQESFARIQQQNQQLSKIEGEKQNLQREKEHNFELFKKEVQMEFETRIKKLNDENLELKETLNSKQLKIQRLRSLQPSLEHYQKEFVKSQLTQETLQQRVEALEKQCERYKKDFEMTDALLQLKTRQYDQDNRMLEQELIQQSNESKRLEEQYRDQIESLNIELDEVSEQLQSLTKSQTNWRSQFIQLNREFHSRQDTILMLETELQIHRNAIRDCNILSSAVRI